MRICAVFRFADGNDGISVLYYSLDSTDETIGVCGRIHQNDLRTTFVNRLKIRRKIIFSHLRFCLNMILRHFTAISEHICC